jgi:hypothetical protein
MQKLRNLASRYEVYTASEELIYGPDWVEHNYNIFLRHHTLSAADHSSQSAHS